MDTQKIEPLLMDYALGATTPEVAALVEAYQETNAEVRAEVEQWRGLADAARQTMADKESNTAPVFPRSRLKGAQRAARWRKTGLWTAALAACLMLGYFAGMRGREEAAAAAPRSNLPVAAVQDFWSTARLRAVAMEDAAQSRTPSDRSIRDLSKVLQRFGG